MLLAFRGKLVCILWSIQQVNKVIIARIYCMGLSFYEEQHPPFCSFHHMTPAERSSIPQVDLGRGVNVGVAVVLESKDNFVLLTRRAAHMRTFANCWVPPGGHVGKFSLKDHLIPAAGYRIFSAEDLFCKSFSFHSIFCSDEGETLYEGALREIYEETGLELRNTQDLTLKVLGIREGAYPTSLHSGLPRRHQLIIYLYCQVPAGRIELNQRIKVSLTHLQI